MLSRMYRYPFFLCVVKLETLFCWLVLYRLVGYFFYVGHSIHRMGCVRGSVEPGPEPVYLALPTNPIGSPSPHITAKHSAQNMCPPRAAMPTHANKQKKRPRKAIFNKVKKKKPPRRWLNNVSPLSQFRFHYLHAPASWYCFNCPLFSLRTFLASCLHCPTAPCMQAAARTTPRHSLPPVSLHIVLNKRTKMLCLRSLDRHHRYATNRDSTTRRNATLGLRKIYSI